MIASLRGRILGSDRDGLVVEVGGVGYRVHASAAAHGLAGLAGEVFLHTHLVVREDAMALYGFASEDERSLFLALLGVGGVGPKAALAIVSAYPAPVLRTAIASEDVALLSSVPGIGKKLAARIAVELRGRLEPVAAAVRAAVPAAAVTDERLAAREALVELGYGVAEAEAALAGTEGPAEERLRQALAQLGSAA